MATKRHATTIKPFEQSSALVTTGVFRFSRNPMYLSMILILIGIALDRLFIVREERMLGDTFGAAYNEYKSKVRRWI